MVMWYLEMKISSIQDMKEKLKIKLSDKAHKHLVAENCVNAQFCVNDDTKLGKDTKLRPVLILRQ